MKYLILILLCVGCASAPKAAPVAQPTEVAAPLGQDELDRWLAETEEDREREAQFQRITCQMYKDMGVDAKGCSK